jgi:hypothetical protein
MFRFTTRDVLWLTLVVAMGVIAWQNFVARGSLELENKSLWTENRQLKERQERREWFNRARAEWLRQMTGSSPAH